MGDLPSGTVTMLFSDIEGSTKLVSRLGDAYAESLSRQRVALRAAWRAWGGHELGTEGDSFFVVFEVARNAVAAALDAQQRLLGTSWPAGQHLRVRMGMHTGEPTRHEDGYVGMDLIRAARVASVAHGGQVVLTDVTASLVRNALPEGARLIDLGEHRLKDLAAPEHLFQVSLPGMEVDFPPLRSLGTSTSLPRTRTPLLGRDGDVAALLDTLADPDARLVTLTGPGGTGKTRLAVAVASAVAESYPDGVYFVPLASATSTEAMWSTITDRLRLREDRGAEGVLDEVAHRRLLLVLDNLEQLPGADAVVAALLSAASELTVVATSRGPLHVVGEHEYAVPPLSLPSEAGAESAKVAPAVQMFCQHAEMVKADFALTDANADTVATICARLDGLPLAIELTAARSRLLSPSALLARLDTALDAASAEADRPVRQRSLRETIQWSHDLLSADLQTFFRRLGVFPGHAALDAVEAVTLTGPDALDSVAALADVSLARTFDGPDGEPRVALLQTVRDFAVDLLETAGQLDEARRRHAEHYAEVAEQVAPDLATPRAVEAGARLSVEHGHLNAALAWSLGVGEPGPVPSDRRAVGARLCVALWWFWASHGHVTAGRRWFDRALEVSAGDDSPAMARLHLGKGIWNMWASDDDGAPPPDLDAALEMARQWGDHVTMAEAASTIAQWYAGNERPEEAEREFERSLVWAEKAGDDSCRATCLHLYADLVTERGEFDRAVAMLDEALAISTRAGNERDVLGRRRDLADVKREAGDTDGALATLIELVPEVVRLREPALSAEIIGAFARLALARGEARRGVVLGSARNRFHAELGWPETVVWEWGAYLDTVRPVLGDAEFEAAKAEGQAMSMSEALELAALPDAGQRPPG